MERRAIVRLRPDPDFGTAQLAGPIDHGGDHRAGDAAAAIAERCSHVGYDQLGGLVRMMVDDRGALADDLRVGERDDKMMAGLGQIGGQAIGPHLFVEHLVGDRAEQGSVGRSDAADFEGQSRARRAGGAV